MICLACGKTHKNPVRSGKVTFLRNCFKKGRPVRRQNDSPPPDSRYQLAAEERQSVLMSRKTGHSALQKALKGWGRNA